MILILAVSLLSVPILPRPAHASSCPLNNANYEIEGCVVNIANGNPVSGLNVYVIECGGFEITVDTTTDSNGYFSFQPINTNCINPYQAYPVSVNGVTPMTWVTGCYVPNCNVLGQAADNPAWGQWVGDVTTNGNGHQSITIQLDQGAVRNVPVAALYSNTGFASLTFSSTTSTSASFSFSGGAVVTAGFQNTWTNTFQTSFGPFSPLSSTIVAYPYYVIPYYCAGSSSEANGPGGGWSCSQGLIKVGLSGPVPPPPNGNGAYVYIPTSEYLNPNSPGGQSSLTCPVTGPQSITSSNDLSSSISVGMTADASFRGVTATVSWSYTTSSSTGSSTSVSFSSTDSQQLNFLLYPASGSCPGLGSGGSAGHGSFGPELHVWDMSASPDFSMSASPTSLSLNQGNIGTSTLSLTGFNGFNGLVPLTWSAPSFISVSFTNTNPTVSSSTVTSTASITVGTNAPAGTYSVTITGANSQFQLTHSVTIQVQVPDFSISASPTSVLVGPGNPATSAITVTSIGGLAGTVNLASAVSPSTGLSCSLNPASVTLGTSATSSLSCSGSDGSYTVTVQGTIGSLSHSTTFAVGVTDFRMSLNPTRVYEYCNSYGCPYAEQLTSSLTISSTSSWSGTVNLSYIPPSPSGGSSVTGPSSVLLPAGGSVTVTLSAVPPNKANTDFFWTIQGTNGPSTTSAILDDYYWVCHQNCPVSLSSGAPAASTSGPSSPSIVTSYGTSSVYSSEPSITIATCEASCSSKGN